MIALVNSIVSKRSRRDSSVSSRSSAGKQGRSKCESLPLLIKLIVLIVIVEVSAQDIAAVRLDIEHSGKVLELENGHGNLRRESSSSYCDADLGTVLTLSVFLLRFILDVFLNLNLVWMLYIFCEKL